MNIKSCFLRWGIPLLLLAAFLAAVFALNRVDKVALVNREGQTFEKGVVVDILQDNLMPDGSRVGEQRVLVRMTTGVRAGQELETTSASGFLFGAGCTVGMKVVVMQSVAGDSTITSIYSQDREWVIYAFAAAYLLVLCLVGGKQGLKGALGLVHDVSSSGATFFIEPMGVVKANNGLKELQAREEKEIERILAELSAECAQFKDDITQDYDLLILLDVIFARAKLAYRMRACAPRIVERGLYLRKARHPLLDPDRAVANDLMLGEDFDTLVITGPNTGGKTVTIKTIGLLTLMAQCGLHIPVSDDSRVKVFRRVLADVGDEQSIAQSLSTFSSHMVNIVGILGEADGETLILFDELGAGTDPIEGAALAAAIIESAREMGALVAATTHYAELKVYAMTTPGVENASCEFNVDSLAPTYRLLIGIPGKSNAFAISERLGLPKSIIQKAAARIDAENVRFEDVLTQLDEQRQEMEWEKEAAARLRREMEETAKASREYKAKMEAERAQAVEKAQAEARAILDEARDTADQVFKELNDMRRRQRKEEDCIFSGLI